MTQKKRPQQHGPSASTILIGLFIAVLILGVQILLTGEISVSGGYDAYAGPIMPLTAVSGGEDLTAQRSVDLDFSTFENLVRNNVDAAKVLVTDTYRLTNTTQEDKQVELAYPYLPLSVSQRGFFPTITVAGQEITPEIYFTMETGQKFFLQEKFDDYKKLLAEKDYFASAMEEPVIADIPVKAYHFTDITYTGAPDDRTPYLTLTFTIPRGVNVWVWDYDRMETAEEKDSYTLWFREDLEEKDRAWLFVANGDIENLTFGGNLGDNMLKDSPSNEVAFEYEILETTFAELMWKFAQEYDYWAENDYSVNPNSADPGLITPEILYRDTMKRLGGNMGKGYDPMFGDAVECVTDTFDFSLAARLQYMVFPVTIPAGQTLTVESKYWKEASYDYMNPEIHTDGFEIAAQLGSNLTFTALSAGIQNSQWINIEAQDMGFDLENGITQVELEQETELYTLTVSHINDRRRTPKYRVR